MSNYRYNNYYHDNRSVLRYEHIILLFVYHNILQPFVSSVTHLFLIFYRYNWQRMCVIKMFAEHISLKFIENEIVVSARRLWMVIMQSFILIISGSYAVYHLSNYPSVHLSLYLCACYILYICLL